MLQHILLVVSILIIMSSTTTWGCPAEVCMCKWKGGKQTVECGGQYLTKIPEGMDPGTQVLNFSGNSLTVLQNERFKKMELINLQKIFLARNQIIRIHERAFRGLSNLVELDLTDNLIPIVPTDTFQDYTSLMRLSLVGNPIKELKTSAFKHLPFLTTLELSNCYIERIEDEAFMGLDNLEWLRLDGNRITNIVGNHILPSSLHGINLQNNRWSCDCNLIDVHRWLNSFKISQTEDPKCMGPAKLTGQLIKAVPVEELACIPEITPTTLYLEIAEGRNISMLCRIAATPEASVSWWFQGEILLNDTFLSPNFHIFYYIDDGPDDEKRSELFIYNTNIDDNGTFACVAENSAGRTFANYTIRIILKEEPVVEQVILPYEYLLVVLSGAVFISLLLFIVMCIFICKCSRKSNSDNDSKKNSNNIKDTNLQLHANQKCSSITNGGGSSQESIIHSKLNGSILFSESSQNDMTLYVANSLQNVNYDNSQNVFNDRCCSPPSARSFQDQNPDLINDAESGRMSKSENEKDKMSDVESNGGPSSLPGSSFESNSTHNFPIQPSLVRPSNVHYQPRNDIARDMYQHQVDVHLNPGYLIDQNGYAVDLSLTNMTVMQQNPVNYYRTLPHKRGGQHHPGGVALRYSNEAEFLYPGNPGPIRYTAEGYPYRPKQNFPSPPDGYKNGSIQQMPSDFCSPQFNTQKWPSCLPGYHPQLQQIKLNPPYERISSPQTMLHSPKSATAMPLQPILKKCVSAQTSDIDQNTIPEQEEDEEENCGPLKHLNGPLADSPDEGYVGDSQESSDL
jgi:hypothetical protein